jgi:hypothetical protein
MPKASHLLPVISARESNNVINPRRDIVSIDFLH